MTFSPAACEMKSVVQASCFDEDAVLLIVLIHISCFVCMFVFFVQNFSSLPVLRKTAVSSGIQTKALEELLF